MYQIQNVESFKFAFDDTLLVGNTACTAKLAPQAPLWPLANIFSIFSPSESCHKRTISQVIH